MGRVQRPSCLGSTLDSSFVFVRVEGSSYVLGVGYHRSADLVAGSRNNRLRIRSASSGYFVLRLSCSVVIGCTFFAWFSNSTLNVVLVFPDCRVMMCSNGFVIWT